MKKILLVPVIAALAASSLNAAVDSTLHHYLLFGQSNMAGGGSGIAFGTGGPTDTVIPADCDTTSRIKVLSFCTCSAKYSADCPKYTQSRTTDTWYTAFPPLHICQEGISPGDWFAKTMLDSVREDIKIGLIPCALSGQALSVFVKGGSGFKLPTWAHPTLGDSSPYAWMIKRCKQAQQTGVIKGMLLHQGESGPGAPTWNNMAKAIFDSLKKDLGLPSTTPVVVGELRADNYAAFNRDAVDAFAKSYTNCGLASSTGCAVQSDDGFHFAAAGMRELGKRYAIALLGLASQSYIPRKGTSHIIDVPVPAAKYPDFKQAKTGITLYSLNGRIMRSYPAADAGSALRRLNAGGGVYIVSCKLSDGRTAIVPFVR